MSSSRARPSPGRGRSVLDSRIPAHLVLDVAEAITREPPGAAFDPVTLTSSRRTRSTRSQRLEYDRDHVRRVLNALTEIGLLEKDGSFGAEWMVRQDRQAHADLIGYDYARFSTEPVTAFNATSEEGLTGAIASLPSLLEGASHRVFGPTRARSWTPPEITTVHRALRTAKRELLEAQKQPRAGDGTLRTATGARFKPPLIDPHGDRGATLYQDPFARVLEETLGLTFENAKRFDGSNLARAWASESAFIRLPLEALLPDLSAIPRSHVLVKLGPPFTVFALVTAPALNELVLDTVLSAQGGPLLAAVLRELKAKGYALPSPNRRRKVGAENVNRAVMRLLDERAAIICPSHIGVPLATHPRLSRVVTFVDPGATLLWTEAFEGRMGSGISSLRSSLGAALTKLERDPTTVEVQLSPLMNRDVGRHLA